MEEEGCSSCDQDLFFVMAGAGCVTSVLMDVKKNRQCKIVVLMDVKSELYRGNYREFA